MLSRFDLHASLERRSDYLLRLATPRVLRGDSLLAHGSAVP
jgi:hypothetical protein